MARHTSFRFCLDPTVEQTVALARHAGAARFAYNQCLRLHLDARERHRTPGASADGVDQARSEVARQITYKQQWRGGRVVVADRWFPSSKTCSSCGQVKADLTLNDRTYTCCHCGHVLDRDLNAAANLAAWAEDHASGEHAQVGDRQAAGPVINACRRDGTGPHIRVGETSPDDAGTPIQAAPAA